jgi:hypothetical protein
VTAEEFRRLGMGDVVRSRVTGESFIVMSNYGARVTAVATADLTHPDEWELVVKAVFLKPDDEEVC